MQGISSKLVGGTASTYSTGCICRNDSEKQWGQLNDAYHSTRCYRCGQVWHYCPIHKTQVNNEPDRSKPDWRCTCSSRRDDSTPLYEQGCFNCGEMYYRSSDDDYLTRICAKCFNLYHICPIHKKSVRGPGYHKSAREQTMCQCHQNLDFLGTDWSKPFG